MKRIICGLAGAVVLSACGPGSVNGKVGGLELDVADAIFIAGDRGDGIQVLDINLTDSEGVCTAFKANRASKNQTALSFRLLFLRDDGNQLTSLTPDKGEYTILRPDQSITKGGHFGWSYFNRTDAACRGTLTTSTGGATSGLVTIKDYKERETISGDFDLTFGGNDKVKGSFHASFCDASTSTSNPSCE